jgi:hypothetical protein
MSVVVQLRGGLGNQLFQYAAGYALATRHGEPLLLNTALLPLARVDRGGVRRWTEQISGFAHEGQIIDSVGSSAARRRIAQSLAGRERITGDSALGRMLGRAVYAHEARDDVEQFRRLRAGARINAYCNSPRFFETAEAEVRRQVTTPTRPGEWYLAEREQLRSDGAVAIHVRWGDYLNLKHVFGTVPAHYYQRALGLVTEVVGDRPVWLFSDDPDGAAEYLRGTVEVARVVQPSAASTALENLLLLSAASGMACANSSFSWWAAYLAEGAGVVVFPRPLFADGGPPEPKDWLKADWIQIGRE